MICGGRGVVALRKNNEPDNRIVGVKPKGDEAEGVGEFVAVPTAARYNNLY